MMSTLTDAEQLELSRALVRLRAIWIALLVAVAAYAAVGLVYDRKVGPVVASLGDLPGYQRALVQYGVYIVAVLALAAGCWLGRAAVGRSGRDTLMGRLFTPAGVAAPETPSEVLRLALASHANRVVTALALCEVSALLGFVSMILVGDPLKLYILCGLSLLAMFYVMPRKSALQQLAERSKQQIP